MTTIKAYAVAVWGHYRLNMLLALMALSWSMTTFIFVLPMDSSIWAGLPGFGSLAAVQPALSKNLELFVAVHAAAIGLFVVVRTLRKVGAELAFHRASPGEQDEMLARETGWTADEVREVRDQLARPLGPGLGRPRD